MVGGQLQTVETALEVPSRGAEGARTRAASPSLVSKGQESTFQFLKHKSQWDRQQRRIYQKLQSWSFMKVSEGYQLIRADFTTGKDGSADLLSKHYAEVMRRVKREFDLDIEHFTVRTAEGHGVLHCMWAIKHDRAAWISQAWLSDQWNEIHGAHRVWIKRVSSKFHLKMSVRYLVNQYLAGQTSIVRCSYSWNKCKIALGRGWSSFKRQTSERRPVLYHEQRYGRDYAVRDLLPMGVIVRAWQSLLEVGWCLVDGIVYGIADRLVYPKQVVAASYGFELPIECPF